MKIIVASKNPVKIKAALLGFESYFTDVGIEGGIETDKIGLIPIYRRQFVAILYNSFFLDCNSK